MIEFLVGAAAGVLAGWAGGWTVTSWWRDWHEEEDGEEYAEELADYPRIEAYEPDDDRCISCGAVVDHHLGCPDDPNPDWEAETELARVGAVVDLREDTLVRVARLCDRDDTAHLATVALLLPSAAFLQRLTA